MNQTGFKYSRCCVIAVTISALLLASGMPLCAQSASQSSTAQSATQPAAPVTTPAAIPAKPGDALPDAPQPQAGQAQSQPQTQQDSSQAPSGAAGAKAANVKGTPAAQPVGAAVAPAKQRGHRSLLIKVGLIAAAAVAVGTVVALSEKSPTRPPGAAPAAQR
jgi:hypothetical protein